MSDAIINETESRIEELRRGICELVREIGRVFAVSTSSSNISHRELRVDSV
uniref:Uncharacterized protein n=1 Tax=Physcomitrium patens TaxID=3218 RepID=A0A2K1KHX8_PHYPA|nr:hypothetical protein PHYPA_007071 [Physcomitrium patens]